VWSVGICMHARTHTHHKNTHTHTHTICNSACPINWIFILGSRKTIKGNFCPFWPDLVRACTQKVVAVLGNHSAGRYKICSHLPLTMCLHVLSDRLRMLQTLLNVCCFSSQVTICIIFTLKLVWFDVRPPEQSKSSTQARALPQLEYGVEVFLCIWYHYERLFKSIFLSLRSWFLMAKTKLVQFHCSVKCVISLGYKDCRMHSTTHLNITCKKI
jgi:hypothetical protein